MSLGMGITFLYSFGQNTVVLTQNRVSTAADTIPIQELPVPSPIIGSIGVAEHQDALDPEYKTPLPYQLAL